MDTPILIERLRKELLTTSYVMPTLVMGMSGLIARLELDDLQRVRFIPMQHSILTELGWETGKKYRGQELKYVYLQASIWRSSTSTHWLIPGDDPNKQEYGLISFWDSSQRIKECSCYLPVHRNSQGMVKKVDFPKEMIPEMSSHLSIFMDGLLHSSMSFEDTMKDLWAKKREQFDAYPAQKRKALIEKILTNQPHLEDVLRQEGFIC